MDNSKKMDNEEETALCEDALNGRTLWQRLFPCGYWKELRGTMNIAWALVLSQVCQIGFQPVSTMFGGHLGKQELDAIALANSLINVFGNSVVIGFSTCLDTLLSQAYGMGNYKMLGIYLQKGLILHLLLLLPCYAIHLNIKPILLALGQPEAVVELTAQYLLYFMPGMFFLFMWTALRKFTQCQNVVIPHIYIVLFGHVVHGILQYLFIYQFKFGTTGSSVAQAITFCLLFMLTAIYTVYSGAYRLCWVPWTWRCLLDWRTIASLGAFGMLMMCLEWWALEATVLVGGALGETVLGAQSVTFYLASVAFGIPSGIGVASCIRVGQFLGAGKKLSSITATRVGMTVTVTNALVWMIIFMACRNELPKIFTNDWDVIQLTSVLMPFVSAFIFFDAIATVGRGLMQGMGRQRSATIIIFIAYYVVALPIGIPLTFLTSLGIIGIWIGLLTSLSITSVAYVIIINFGVNWDTLVIEARQRVRGKTKQADADEKTSPYICFRTCCFLYVVSCLLHVESTYIHFIVSLTTLALISGSSSEAAFLATDTKVPKGVYVKRAVTVTVFLLVFLAGLAARLTTSQNATPDAAALPDGPNATALPFPNGTDVTLENVTVTGTVAFQ